MGYKQSKYEFSLDENEQFNTTFVLEKETRSVFHGIVLDADQRPLKGVVVKLWEILDKEKCCDLLPISHTFTDECGSFLFGPLLNKKHYVIKFCYDSVIIKHIESNGLK